MCHHDTRQTLCPGEVTAWGAQERLTEHICMGGGERYVDRCCCHCLSARSSSPWYQHLWDAALFTVQYTLCCLCSMGWLSIHLHSPALVMSSQPASQRVDGQVRGTQWYGDHQGQEWALSVGKASGIAWPRMFLARPVS